MIRRILLLTSMGVLLSGCFMAPLAFVGPAASGFSSASIIQSGIYFWSKLYGQTKHRKVNY